MCSIFNMGLYTYHKAMMGLEIITHTCISYIYGLFLDPDIDTENISKNQYIPYLGICLDLDVSCISI